MSVPPDVFVKEQPDAPTGFFEVEAARLRWLAVPGGVPVVQPLEVSPGGSPPRCSPRYRRPAPPPRSSAAARHHP